MKPNTSPQSFPRTSPGFNQATILGPLTDHQISEYKKKGWYGPVCQRAALMAQELRDANRRKKKERRKQVMAAVHDLLK